MVMNVHSPLTVAGAAVVLCLLFGSARTTFPFDPLYGLAAQIRTMPNCCALGAGMGQDGFRHDWCEFDQLLSLSMPATRDRNLSKCRKLSISCG